jgi:hypothetical protein
MHLISPEKNQNGKRFVPPFAQVVSTAGRLGRLSGLAFFGGELLDPMS